MKSLESKSHWIYKYVYHVLQYDSKTVECDFWCKLPPDYLYELCVTASTSDHVGKKAKSAGETTITNFLLFLKHQHAPCPFPRHTVSWPRVSPYPPSTLLHRSGEVSLTVWKLCMFSLFFILLWIFLYMTVQYACDKINNCCDSNFEENTVQAWQFICCLKAPSLTSRSEDPTKCHPIRGSKPLYLGWRL